MEVSWFETVGNKITSSTRSCEATKLCRFVAEFGMSPYLCAIVWLLLKEMPCLDRSTKKCHLLWALHWLKTNCTEASAHNRFGMDEKTFRHWKYCIVTKLSELDVVSSHVSLVKFSAQLTSFCPGKI